MITILEGMRQQQGWTQEDLAARSGISRGTIVRIENFRSPSSVTASKIAHAFAVDLGLEEESEEHLARTLHLRDADSDPTIAVAQTTVGRLLAWLPGIGDNEDAEWPDLGQEEKAFWDLLAALFSVSGSYLLGKWRWLSVACLDDRWNMHPNEMRYILLFVRPDDPSFVEILTRVVPQPTDMALPVCRKWATEIYDAAWTVYAASETEFPY